MRKKWIIALTSMIFSALLTPLNAADDKPDFADPYVPQIKSLSLSYEQKKINNQYIVETSFDLTVRVHRNPLSVFQILFKGPKTSTTAPCQEWMGGTRLTYGDNINAKQGDFKVPTGLISRNQVGDWYEEKHQFKISNNTAWPPVNLNFSPCIGEVKGFYIQMKDLAGHGVKISDVELPYVESANQGNFDDLPLDPEQKKCGLNSNSTVKPCTHNIQWSNLNLTFTTGQEKSTSQIQVVDYQTLNIGLQSQITTLNSEKSGLQTQITTLGADKIALQNQVTTLTSDKSTLSGQITKLTSEKLALQGQLSASNADKATLSGQVSTLTTANSALTVNVAELTGKLSAANKKLTAICKAKPKPKGC